VSKGKGKGKGEGEGEGEAPDRAGRAYEAWRVEQADAWSLPEWRALPDEDRTVWARIAAAVLLRA